MPIEDIIVDTLVQNDSNVWYFSNHPPRFLSPTAHKVHQAIVDFVSSRSVLWRMSSMQPSKMVKFMGWYGRYELTGIAAFAFCTFIPDRERRRFKFGVFWAMQNQ